MEKKGQYFSPQQLNQLEGCIGNNLRMASRAVSQFYDDILRPSGLSINQFSVLSNIAMLEETTITTLAESLSMDRTTMTRNLKPLARDGLIEVIEGKEDRRMRLVRLTERGQKAVAKALPLWDQAQTTITTEMGQQKCEELLQTLAILRNFVHP